MKLKNLKIGDKIEHYCFGSLITGTVIEIGKNQVKTKHDPIRWGDAVFEETNISESSDLQKRYGGTDKNGLPGKGADTTPKSFFKGKEITI